MELIIIINIFLFFCAFRLFVNQYTDDVKEIKKQLKAITKEKKGE